MSDDIAAALNRIADALEKIASPPMRVIPKPDPEAVDWKQLLGKLQPPTEPDRKTVWARINAYEQHLIDEGVDLSDSYDSRVRALKQARVQQIEADLKDCT